MLIHILVVRFFWKQLWGLLWVSKSKILYLKSHHPIIWFPKRVFSVSVYLSKVWPLLWFGIGANKCGSADCEAWRRRINHCTGVDGPQDRVGVTTTGSWCTRRVKMNINRAIDCLSVCTMTTGELHQATLIFPGGRYQQKPAPVCSPQHCMMNVWVSWCTRVREKYLSLAQTGCLTMAT